MFEQPQVATALAVVGIAFLMSVAYVLGLRAKRQSPQDLDELQTWRAWYLRLDCIYRTPTGQTRYCNLRSFDGGQTWYAVEIDGTFYSVKVLGPAHDVYPGILRQVGLEELSDFCFLNGGPTLEGELAAYYQAILQRVGVQALPRP